MILNKQKLKGIISSIAAQKKFRPSMVEKDYYSTIIINNNQTLIGDQWAVLLRGGAAISKVYFNQFRLSYDLDFAIYTNDKTSHTLDLRLQMIASIRDNMGTFLKAVDLKCADPYGKLKNGKTHITFDVQYPSLFSEEEGGIKVDIALNHMPLETPEYHVISHFYQDPLTGKDLIPQGRMLVPSLNELVAGKLSCSITRKDIRVRDYYDLGYIANTGFNFYKDHFIKLFKQDLMNYLNRRNYQRNSGLSIKQIDQLNKQKEEFLLPYIRTDEEFSLDRTLESLNQILLDKRLDSVFRDYYQPLMVRPFKITMKRLMGRMPL